MACFTFPQPWVARQGQGRYVFLFRNKPSRPQPTFSPDKSSMISCDLFSKACSGLYCKGGRGPREREQEPRPCFHHPWLSCSSLSRTLPSSLYLGSEREGQIERPRNSEPEGRENSIGIGLRNQHLRFPLLLDEDKEDGLGKPLFWDVK